MPKKEFKIGETFRCGLVILKCVKAKLAGGCCEGCFFHFRCFKNSTGVISGPCARTEREDKTDVVFIKEEDL